MRRSRDQVRIDDWGNPVHDDRPRVLTEPRRVWVSAGHFFSSERSQWRDPSLRHDGDVDPLELFERLQ